MVPKPTVLTDEVLVAIVVWYLIHGTCIPSFLKFNCTVTLTFDLEGQGHILFHLISHHGEQNAT